MLQIMLPRVATQVTWLNSHWGAPPVGNRNIITEPSFLLLMLRRVQIWTRRKSAITNHWETALTITLSSAKTSGWYAGWNAVLSVHITCQLTIHYNDIFLIRLFLSYRLLNKTIEDGNIWQEGNIDYPIQKDSQSCGVFMLKVCNWTVWEF